MSLFSIDGRVVLEEALISVLQKLRESDRGNYNFSSEEIGDLLDAYVLNGDEISEVDRHVFLEQNPNITEEEFNILAQEYKRRFPNGKKMVYGSLWGAARIPLTDPEESARIALEAVRFENPIELDVNLLVNSIPGAELAIHDLGFVVYSSTGEIIACLSTDEGGKITEIYSSMTKDEIAGYFSALNSDQLVFLSGVLDLPVLDECGLRRHEKRLEQASVDLELFDQYHSLSTVDTVDSTYETPNFSLIRGIGQGEYGVTTANADKPIIGTQGLGPCIAITIYRRGRAAVAHLDPIADTRSISQMLDDMEIPYSDNEVEIRIIGGNKESRWLAIRMLKVLEERDLAPIQFDVMDKYHKTAVSIDARDGSVYFGLGPNDYDEEIGRNIFDLRPTGEKIGESSGYYLGLIKSFDGISG